MADLVLIPCNLVGGSVLVGVPDGPVRFDVATSKRVRSFPSPMPLAKSWHRRLPRDPTCNATR